MCVQANAKAPSAYLTLLEGALTRDATGELLAAALQVLFALWGFCLCPSLSLSLVSKPTVKRVVTTRRVLISGLFLYHCLASIVLGGRGRVSMSLSQPQLLLQQGRFRYYVCTITGFIAPTALGSLFVTGLHPVMIL